MPQAFAPRGLAVPASEAVAQSYAEVPAQSPHQPAQIGPSQAAINAQPAAINAQPAAINPLPAAINPLPAAINALPAPLDSLPADEESQIAALSSPQYESLEWCMQFLNDEPEQQEAAA